MMRILKSCRWLEFSTQLIPFATAILVMLSMAQSADCALLVLEVNGTSVDIGGDGSTDYDFNIDIINDQDTFRTLDANAEHLAPGGSFPDSALRSWRLTDSVTSGPTPSTPVAGTAFYTDLDAAIVSNAVTPALISGFIEGSDNFVGIRFVDSNVNGGATTYGFAQIFADAATGDAHSIVRIIYDDAGGAITLADVADAIGESAAIPEPASSALLGLGLLAMSAYRRRMNRKTECA